MSISTETHFRCDNMLLFGLDVRLWEGVGAVLVTVYRGERWEGVVEGNGQAGGIIVDGGSWQSCVTMYVTMVFTWQQ
jgi:hypothetical protein